MSPLSGNASAGYRPFFPFTLNFTRPGVAEVGLVFTITLKIPAGPVPAWFRYFHTLPAPFTFHPTPGGSIKAPPGIATSRTLPSGSIQQQADTVRDRVERRGEREREGKLAFERQLVEAPGERRV